MLERQTNALVLRGWSGQHSVSALLQPMSGRSDARFYRGLSVRDLIDNPRKSLVTGDVLADNRECVCCDRLTACLSLLKWLVDKVNAEDEDAMRSTTGAIPLKALDFAIKRCSDYISAQSHEDIDQEAEKIWSHQWDQFISWYYQIVHGQALFVRTNVPFNVRHYRRQVDCIFLFVYTNS